MSVKKKFGIVLLVVVGLFVAQFVAEGISLALETDEEREEREQRSIEKKQQELQKQIEENKLPTKASDIDPSKLKWALIQTNDKDIEYFDNAEKILTEYVLEYKGKDKSGKTMKEDIMELAGCPPELTDFDGEIMEWDDKKIEITINNEIITCEKYFDLDFIYTPSSDSLDYDREGGWVELTASIMNYLDINP